MGTREPRVFFSKKTRAMGRFCMCATKKTQQFAIKDGPFSSWVLPYVPIFFHGLPSGNLT
jgi:hypothetical protein